MIIFFYVILFITLLTKNTVKLKPEVIEILNDFIYNYILYNYFFHDMRN